MIFRKQKTQVHRVLGLIFLSLAEDIAKLH
jgi:hypothetical protein